MRSSYQLKIQSNEKYTKLNLYCSGATRNLVNLNALPDFTGYA